MEQNLWINHHDEHIYNESIFLKPGIRRNLVGGFLLILTVTLNSLNDFSFS